MDALRLPFPSGFGLAADPTLGLLSRASTHRGPALTRLAIDAAGANKHPLAHADFQPNHERHAHPTAAGRVPLS
jgi:hypothetical protein